MRGAQARSQYRWPLTTQFTPPAESDCAIWAYATDDRSVGEPYEVRFFYSDPSDERFTACQPSGWADRPDTLRFAFSPAVCPSGWTWYRIGLAATASHDASSKTTAICCAAGFTPYLDRYADLAGYAESCALDLAYYGATAPTTTTVSLASGSMTTVTSALFIHEAWSVTWREADRAMLTPKPPALTDSTTLIFVWDGKASSIADNNASRDTNNAGEERSWGEEPLFLFMVFGLPIIIVLCAVGLCCWCWLSSKKAKRRDRRAN